MEKREAQWLRSISTGCMAIPFLKQNDIFTYRTPFPFVRGRVGDGVVLSYGLGMG
ncbi:MAG: hypothetical protein Q7J07_07545 [Pelolinea sp.]|nr:hypothetical protein [Pelolinea sp.]